MRTTVDMQDTLFRDLKALSALQGKSLKDFIREAVEDKIQKSNSQTQNRVKFPLLASEEPGALHLTNADIEDLLA